MAVAASSTSKNLSYLDIYIFFLLITFQILIIADNEVISTQ